jgi:hypothetical protein
MNSKLKELLVLIFLFIVFIIYEINQRFNFKNNLDLNIQEEDISSLVSDFWIIIHKTNETSSTDHFKHILDKNSQFECLLLDDENKKVFILKRNTFKLVELKVNSTYFINDIYLNLIKYGARFVYVIDGELAIYEKSKQILVNFNPNKNEYGISFDCKSDSVLNIYAHFGQPSICPHEFPCNTNLSSQKNNKFTCGARKTSIIQQSLVDNFPDVGYAELFDNTSPSVQIPIYKLAPLTTMNTFYHSEAFWSLYTPAVYYKSADVVKSYWTQRLLWLLNETVAFYAPNSFRKSPISANKTPQNINLNDLVDILYKWRCNRVKFFECILDLSKLMSDKNYMSEIELENINKWLQDLISAGYEEPEIVNYENSLAELKTKCENNSSHFKLVYNSANSNESFKSLKSNQTIEYLNRFCSVSRISLLNSSNASFISKKYPDITLLVSFNQEPSLDVLILLKYIYSSYFKNIIFCGPKMIFAYENLKYQEKMLDGLTFLELETQGSFHYSCMTKAIELGLNTRGLLLISDDVLLKYWRFAKEFNFDRMGVSFVGLKSNGFEENEYDNFTCKYEMKADGSNWHYWSTTNGFSAVNRVWISFEHFLRDSTQKLKFESDRIRRFMASVNNHADVHNSSRVKVCIYGSDIFYIPESKFEDFHYFSGLFRQNGVFLELALSTLIAGLDYDGLSIQKIDGEYHWASVFDMSMYDEIVQ